MDMIQLISPIILILLLAALLFFTGCVPIDFFIHRTNPKYASVQLPNDDIAFHDSLFIADMHADSLLFARDLNNHSCLAHVDFPRLKIANMGLQVFTIVSEVKILGCNVLFFTDGETSPMARTVTQANNLSHFVNENDSVTLLKNKNDLKTFSTNNFILDNGSYRRQAGSKNTAALLGIEGAQMLDANNLERDFQKILNLNVRLIGVAHQFDNQFASSAEGKTKGGLTPAGKKLIHLMVTNGVVLDLAHASENTIKDVIEMNKKKGWNRPLLVSHTGLNGHIEKARNLRNDQAVAIAKSNGVIGIMYWDQAVRDRNANNWLDIDSAVDAIVYLHDLLSRNGVASPYQHIGLGSDYDGFIAAPFAVDKLNILTSRLLQRGVDAHQVSQIMGGNVLRVMSAWLKYDD
jgi:membrane dipeptidase